MNHSEIGVICTNLAIVWGPHIVEIHSSVCHEYEETNDPAL